MHKNPFVPTPGYSHPQPPLPPGPPPQQPSQADYSAYWAAAAAQGQGQPPTVGTYANQWTAPQPAQQAPRPTPEQSALYANYGYGGNQHYWQQQQQRQQTYQPPPPVAQPPPPPPQPGYNPYQPQAPYQQPYIPQTVPQQPPPQPIYQQQHPQLQAQPTQQYFPQQPRQHQNRQQHNPQHVPPAKRQRFDPPRNPQQHFQQQTPFQPGPTGGMPPPMQQQQQQQPNFQPQNQPSNSQGRSGGPPGVNQMPLGGRGGSGGGRGGGRVKPGSMNVNRGGSGGRGGRGGMYGNNNRGGNAGQGGGNFRNHARGGFGNRDHGNRRGGSFNAGAYSHQQGSSFRGRYNRSGRHDGGSFTARDSNASGSKKEEHKRTVSDFKLVGLEIQELSWSWGGLPLSSVKTEAQEGLIATEPIQLEAEESVPSAEDDAPTVNGADTSVKTESGEPAPLVSKSEVTGSVSDGAPSADNTPSPPSRLRIYFHTPVTAEDAVPIPHASALPVDASSISLMSTKRGKRKRVDDEDEDGDFESVHLAEPNADGDAMSVTGAASLDGAGRDSVAPSVTETVSEGDWLMAAIGEDDDASNVDDDQLETQNGEERQDGNDVDDPDMRDAEMSNAGTSHIVPVEDLVVPAGSDNTDTVVSEPDHSSSATLASTAEAGIADNQAVHDPSAEQNVSDDFTSMPVNHVQTTDSGLNILSEEQSTDQPGSSDKQVSDDGRHCAPLQAASSFASTVPDSDVQDASYSEYSATLVNDEISGFIESNTQLIPNAEDTQDISMANVGDTVSANRLAISYAAASRRIIINAEVVGSLKVFRKDRRIEISMTIEKDGEHQLKGIVVEALSETTKTYTPLRLSSDAYESDSMLPPFLKAPSSSKLTLLVHLDAEKPNVEPKWVKSGDIQEWLKTMFGRMFWVRDDVADGWEKKIEVVDPDPAPTIRTVLDSWATNGNVGTQTERQRFVRTHLGETDNILEILLRLVRGERATPFSQSGSSVGVSQNSVPGPLLSAIAGSAHGAQQTHVSLAVLALFRMAVEFARKADGDKGKTEVEERMGEIVRCLPSHLLHKSLDGMFKEWKADKKGGR